MRTPPRSRKALFRVVAATVALLGASILGACGGNRQAEGHDFVSAVPGVLTVATANVPAPGFWEGTVEAPTGGFEEELARRLADRLGLGSIRIVVVPFADIATGRLGGADLALTQMTATDEREQHADFSTAYLTAPPGVLTRPDVEVRDHAGLQELRWVVLDVSTLTPVVQDRIRPDTAPLEVGDRAAELDAVRSGQADAVLLDLPVAQGVARSQPGTFAVAGQLSGAEGLSAVFPKDSPNVEVVDSAIRALAADGTLGDLAERWLGAGSSIPLIRVED